VQVQQAAPQISVQQPEPKVTVRQANPEILVRQPAPTVTVDIPTPEIIVRMPQPDVNVAMAQPQVEVQQPEPNVQIVQPEQPAVQVEQAQPQVNVEQGQAQVSVQEQGQPQVQYESAKPKVVINQPQAPKIRYEQMQSSQAQQQQTNASDQPGAAQEQALATGERQTRKRTTEEQQAYMKRFGGEVKAKVTDAQAAISVNDIKGMNVWNSQGERLGEVDEVIAVNNKPFAVIAHGGFLGIGEDKVAFPLERFVRSNDNTLVIHGVTEQDIAVMDEWQSKVNTENARLADTEQVKLQELQSK
jgi:hypothetical protein